MGRSKRLESFPATEGLDTIRDENKDNGEKEAAMSTISARTRPALAFRDLVMFDVGQVARIEQQTSTRPWNWAEFVAALDEGNTFGRVVELANQIAGFMVYRVIEQPDTADEGTVKRLLGLCWNRSPDTQSSKSLHLELLDIAVAPDWQRQGVGRSLLEELNRKLREAGDCIHATVPETNVPIQLCLRAVGYKAIRVLRGHFGTEDGYLMERRRS